MTAAQWRQTMVGALAAAGVLLPGCALSQELERGECTLDSVTQRIIHSSPPAPDEMIALEPPYVVTMTHNLDFGPGADVILEGHGWHHPGEVDVPDSPTATVVAPNGETSVIPNAMAETLTVEHVLDAPGTWTFTVEWELIDCLQTVTVRALPPQ